MGGSLAPIGSGSQELCDAGASGVCLPVRDLVGEPAMQEFKLRREKHPHFMSVVATGMTLTGPLGDGLVHLVFHRDGTRVVEETFDAEMQDEAGGQSMLLHGPTKPATMEYFREEVASVLIPAEKVASFAEAINRLSESFAHLRSKPDQ